MHKVLIADDEKEIREICKTYFEYEGFKVVLAEDGQKVIDLVDDTFDLLILDIMMPIKTGYEVVNEINDNGICVPYIFLTAKVTENDVIYGLIIGADDYIRKPFSPKELIIRSKKVINNHSKKDEIQKNDMYFGRLCLSIKRRTATIDNEDLLLRQKEFELLYYLAINEHHAVSKSELLEKVWGYEFTEDMNTINVHIHRIREKLAEYNYYDYIINTVWGLGYKFERGE